MSRSCERIACLWIPSWPLQALLRAQPELRQQKLAVCDEKKPSGVVLGATLAARNMGVRAGHTVAQAQSLCGDLLLERLRDTHRQEAREALHDVASAFSPSIECHDGCVLCGVGDLSKLFPDEGLLAKALAAQAETVRLYGRVAIANQAGTAKLLAQAKGRITVVKAGDEKLHLRPLPLSVLPLTAQQRLLLERFGLRTLGDFMALPRTALPLRLGKAGVSLHRLASGEDETPLTLTPPPPDVSESFDLDEPETLLEPLLFLLRGLLDRVVARLKTMSLSCGGFSVEFFHHPQGVRTVEVKVASPTRDVAVLMDLLRLTLQARPPDTAVCALSVRTRVQRPKHTQLGLFDGERLYPEQLMNLVARLSALVGDDAVGQAAVVDSHLPGLATVLPLPPPTNDPDDTPDPKELAPQMAIHLFRPPQQATVVQKEGKPAWIAAERINGPIVFCGGPYRLRAGSGTEDMRDYFDIEVPSGEAFRLYCEHNTGIWFLDGRYD